MGLLWSSPQWDISLTAQGIAVVANLSSVSWWESLTIFKAVFQTAPLSSQQRFGFITRRARRHQTRGVPHKFFMQTWQRLMRDRSWPALSVSDAGSVWNDRSMEVSQKLCSLAK